jgi:hypothetical protein
MVKNSPENAVTRVKSIEDQKRPEARHFPGALPRSMEALSPGLGVSAGACRTTKGEEQADAAGVALCSSQRTTSKMRNVDFGDAIGKELQTLFDDLVAQPVPDRFLNLLNQLEKNMVSSGVSSSAPGERE